MDRPIEHRELMMRRGRKVAITAGALAAALVLLLGLRWWLQPAVNAGQVRIARVERGPVEAAILCAGTVVPGTEQVVSCPFDARVKRILEQPGAMLSSSQALVELDGREVELEVARLGDQIALEQNRRRELELASSSRVDELEGQCEIARERLAFLEAKTSQQRALFDLGLTAVFNLRQAELEERVARIELRQLEEKIEREREAASTQLDGLAIEIELLAAEEAEQQQRLHRATVRAERPGVLTWIRDEEGATLREGEVVARVADLSRFRVEASVSDLHAGRIAVGMPARVVVGDATLSGHVANIPPAIDKGSMTLNVELDEAVGAGLRPNLRVDVYVITEARQDALRLTKGPFVNGGGEQQVFVVRGTEAVRTTARIGVSGIEYYEVLAGLEEGDEVIVSNMADRLHVERLRLRGR